MSNIYKENAELCQEIIELALIDLLDKGSFIKIEQYRGKVKDSESNAMIGSPENYIYKKLKEGGFLSE